ncbi:MAG: hypothetical protein IKT58_00440 [Oscillospiraceae bacterium]|nr:hypothetical protein [Oscillospiraceae bacterium]
MRFNIADFVIEFSGDPPLEISPLWELFRSEGGPCPNYRVTRRYSPTLPEAEGAHYFYDGVKNSHYCMSREWEKELELTIVEEFFPWGRQIHQLYEECALPHVLLHGQRLVLHASYVAYQNAAILFTAPSGTGKSTQAELWRQYRGAEILNGDRAVVGLRGDRAYAFGFPMCGSSEYCENRSLPLTCIVSLRQGPENRIRRLIGREALKVILNGTYADPKHPGDFSRNIEVAISLLQTPVFELSCRPDVGAVEALEQALAQLSP